MISPVGAPSVAWSIGAACNIPWEGDYNCAVTSLIAEVEVLIGNGS
jgi:hypothetical protein